MSTMITIMFDPFLPHTINLVAVAVWYVLGALAWLAITEKE